VRRLATGRSFVKSVPHGALRSPARGFCAPRYFKVADANAGNELPGYIPLVGWKIPKSERKINPPLGMLRIFAGFACVAHSMPRVCKRRMRSTATSSNNSLIHLENIKKVFMTDEVETHALSEVHLDINKGEFVSIAGPSGCGKSTLLSILGLLDSPTEGTYVLNGHSVASLGPAERARIRNREVGFIFQSFNLIGDLTVFENVELPLTYRGMNAAERKQRVNAALEKVGMGHRTRHYPSQLSGGQQQRVAVARALGGKPAILLADEPTGNLDSKNGDAVMDLLEDLHREGATICMVTHDPRFARHADRTIHLFDGQIVKEPETGSEPDLAVPYNTS